MKAFKVALATTGLALVSVIVGIQQDPVSAEATVSDDTFIQETVYEPMLQEIVNLWDEIYEFYDFDFSSGAYINFITGDNTAVCGSEVFRAEGTEGPAYCFGTDEIIIPTGFTTALVEGEFIESEGASFQISPVGENGIFFLLAHEWGHNVQDEILGTEAALVLDSVALENNADCLAGVAVAGVDRLFYEDDVDQIINMAIEIGEPGRVAHGTPEERMDALVLGLVGSFTDDQFDPLGVDLCFITYFPELFEEPAQAPAETVYPDEFPEDPVTDDIDDLQNRIQEYQWCVGINWPYIEDCHI